MFKGLLARFQAADTSGAWPKARIVDQLRRQYESVDLLGEDQGFVLYGISDRGVNFIVALVEAQAGAVNEIGFLARFVGFSVDAASVEYINRNLHLSVAGIEEEGDLYLLAGVEAAGAYDDGMFQLILEAWKRDMLLVLHTLSGKASFAAAFPAARSGLARKFAVNRAPLTEEGAAPDLLKAYFGDVPVKSVCGECGGRGRRGVIARRCDACDGAGFTGARP